MKFSQLGKSTFRYVSQPVFLVNFWSTLVNWVIQRPIIPVGYRLTKVLGVSQLTVELTYPPYRGSQQSTFIDHAWWTE